MAFGTIAELHTSLKDLVAASVAGSSVNFETELEVNERIELKAASSQVGQTESPKVQLHRRLGSFFVNLDTATTITLTLSTAKVAVGWVHF